MKGQRHAYRRKVFQASFYCMHIQYVKTPRDHAVTPPMVDCDGDMTTNRQAHMAPVPKGFPNPNNVGPRIVTSSIPEALHVDISARLMATSPNAN